MSNKTALRRIIQPYISYFLLDICWTAGYNMIKHERQNNGCRLPYLQEISM